MLLTTLLFLSLANGDGVGADPPAEVRPDSRLRGALAFSLGGVGARTVGGGPGVSGEIGLTLVERVSILFRLSAGTILVLHAFQGTLAMGVALGESFELSAGAAAGFAFGLGEGVYGSLAALIPLRVVYRPQPRGAT